MSNGLTKGEQKQLEHTLPKLEAVGTLRLQLFGKEGRLALDLMRRIRDRLHPADAATLQSEAAKLFELLAGVHSLELARDEMT